MTEAGTYYFLIKENSRNPMGGVVYDNTRYHITVVVTDNGKGSLEAATFILKVTDEASEPAETIAFVNEYNAATANVVLDGITEKSDAEGNAKFTLTFTEDDIGKVFHYTLTEVNSGAEGVTYSTAEYAITVEIALNKETNTLAATLIQNEAETAELVADFENIYEMDIPSNPQTGDTAHMALWLALLLISCGAVITLYTCDKRKNGEDAFAE